MAGCGGGSTTTTSSDNGGQGSGVYRVEVPVATFPAVQHIDSGAVMRIDVRNIGDRPLPNLTATITTDNANTSAPAFATRDDQPGLAEPSRPFWIIDLPPVDGASALANSWTLGSVAPGETKSFIWQVHPIRSGARAVRWRIAPAFNGGSAQLADGSAPTGRFPVVVRGIAPSATIEPNGSVKKDFSAKPATPQKRSGGVTP